ncbi:conserved hypothetical protein [Nitrosomonas mobilis]|uniref:Toxin CptA n=2 Tax=Nitrosomonas mobilis TaxID=51642 RepID=A0A1G5SGW7_9PROT|nr:conserved hypothetical protein [Nitrosomonas mobilis]
MAHGFAAAAILPTILDYPVAITLVTILLLVSSLAHTLWRHVWLQSAQSVVSLRLTGKDICEVRLLSNDYLNYMIDAGTFVAPYLTVLSLKTNRCFQRRTIVILPDSVDRESFRQLRVWLRWK